MSIAKPKIGTRGKKNIQNFGHICPNLRKFPNPDETSFFADNPYRVGRKNEGKLEGGGGGEKLQRKITMEIAYFMYICLKAKSMFAPENNLHFFNCL